MRKTSSSAVFRGPLAYSHLLWLSWVSWEPAPKETVMEGREPGETLLGRAHSPTSWELLRLGAQMLFPG